MGKTVSVVIPTYGREKVLLDTIESVLLCAPSSDHILIIDQTRVHLPQTRELLESWNASGLIDWMHLAEPSITKAMNAGLARCTTEVVLFLDDDVVPSRGLIEAHAGAYADRKVGAVVGQVLQPGDLPVRFERRAPPGRLGDDLNFPFNATVSTDVKNVIGCNFSVRREDALSVGGFDENFIGAAYRFETEFARRLGRSGKTIRFEPEASIRHLRSERGGTRAGGGHMASGSPMHGVGDYYFALREGSGLERSLYMLRRPFREVRTKFHLRHPWWIPIKFAGEIRALLLALKLYRQGPRYVQMEGDGGE